MDLTDRIDYSRYIFEFIRGLNIDLNIELNYETDGFYYCMYEEGERFVIGIPDKKLNWLTKLAVKHEIGHCYTYKHYIRGINIKRRVRDIKEKHWIFKRIQKVWYWNKCIRWIKKKMGYSMDIDYTENDISYGDVTHGESEFLADAFALGYFR